MRKIVIAAAVITIGLCISASAFAQATDLTVVNRPNQWKLLNLEATKGIWNVQKPSGLDDGGIAFTFGDVLDNWYSIYFVTHAGDITNKTITATFELDVTADTLFFTRSTACANTGVDAYVRLHFQKLDNGVWEYTDYWWSNAVAVNLNDLKGGGTLTITADTGDGSQWQDIIGGETGLVKPAEFAALLAAKKSLGVAFGSACRWASGVAVTGGGGTFKLRSFTIQ